MNKPLRHQPLREEMHGFVQAKILAVASELFFEKGYSQTRLDDIAARLSVGKPFIYQFFDSKTDILVGVCGTTTASAAALASSAAEGTGSATQRLGLLVHGVAQTVIEGRVHLGVLFREEKHLPPAAVQALADDRRTFNRSLRAVLQAGVASGEFRIADIAIAAESISGMTTWIFSWYRPSGRLSAEEVAAQMRDLALRCVGVEPDGSEGVSSAEPAL